MEYGTLCTLSCIAMLGFCYEKVSIFSSVHASLGTCDLACYKPGGKIGEVYFDEKTCGVPLRGVVLDPGVLLVAQKVLPVIV